MRGAVIDGHRAHHSRTGLVHRDVFARRCNAQHVDHVIVRQSARVEQCPFVFTRYRRAAIKHHGVRALVVDQLRPRRAGQRRQVRIGDLQLPNEVIGRILEEATGPGAILEWRIVALQALVPAIRFALERFVVVHNGAVQQVWLPAAQFHHAAIGRQ